MKKRGGAFSRTIIAILGACLVFNALSWISPAFADFYVINIFPVFSGIYGRITSLVGFSVGEVMLVFIVLFIVFSIVFVLMHSAFLAYGRFSSSLGKRYFSLERIFSKISGVLFRVAPVILTITVVVMSLNCFVLYHTTKLSVGTETAREDHDLQDLTNLRDYVVKKCNDLAEKVPHDDDGNVLYEGSMATTAIRSMQGISKDYPRLSGYYVTPKALYFSDFMCQQYMQGYYFPFSMEANYNDTMNLTHKPFTMCHELAHTHGYIYEDEANFFGFLACINSDDIVFQYSGYLGVLNYINNDFYDAVGRDEYYTHVRISRRVRYDNQFLSQEGWKQVEDNAILPTETVKKAADTFIDTNLKVNGVKDGKVSYSHVVGLIMDYYYSGNDI